MSAAAKPLGGELIAQEQALDQLFAKGEITPDCLAAATAAISERQGRLRSVHLSAHLETRALLNPDQVVRYAQLWGYGDRQAPVQRDPAKTLRRLAGLRMRHFPPHLARRLVLAQPFVDHLPSPSGAASTRCVSCGATRSGRGAVVGVRVADRAIFEVTPWAQAGDYNVMPTDLDVNAPEGWVDRAVPAGSAQSLSPADRAGLDRRAACAPQ
jgi:hypothetical protein